MPLQRRGNDAPPAAAPRRRRRRRRRRTAGFWRAFVVRAYALTRTTSSGACRASVRASSARVVSGAASIFACASPTSRRAQVLPHFAVPPCTRVAGWGFSRAARRWRGARRWLTSNTVRARIAIACACARARACARACRRRRRRRRRQRVFQVEINRGHDSDGDSPPASGGAAGALLLPRV